MKLHVLAVGQADAMVLELPSGRLAVIDLGHDYLLEYLAKLDPQASRRFAFCLVTHAHHDHYACIEEFIKRYDQRVEEYWFSFVNPGNISSLHTLFAAAFRRTGGRTKARLLKHDLAAAQPFVLEPGVEVTQFCPNTQEIYCTVKGDQIEENNRSVVLLVRYGRTAALLGADAEHERWQRIVSQAENANLSLAVDVVKAPHHGAATPHGIPASLWPALFRSATAFGTFSVGATRADKPDRTTIAAVRHRAQIRCTGRSAICRPLPAQRPSHSAQPTPDLVTRALLPAPETRWTPPCFGTQVYEFDPVGTVTLTTSVQPASLDACL